MAAVPDSLLVLSVGLHELCSVVLASFAAECSGVRVTLLAMLLPACPEPGEVDSCLDRGTGPPAACRFGNIEAGRSGPSADLPMSCPGPCACGLC